MGLFSDIIIVGAGVTGCSVARELSRYDVRVTVLDRACDVSEGASKANSGIVHAGYDAAPGSQKAKYNVEGAKLYEDLCASLSVSYSRCGAYVLAFSEDDRKTLEDLFSRGVKNGVEHLSIVEKDELLKSEPNLNPSVVCALSVPTSAIVSPYELTFALADDAALNGVSFRLNENVSSVSKEEGVFLVRTDRNEYTCSVLINAAGGGADRIHNQLSEQKIRVINRRGQYYLLDRQQECLFSRTIFQCPTVMGKGVLMTPTVHGNLLIGPNAEDIESPLMTETTQEGLDFVLSKAKLTCPQLSLRTNITNFSGVRAHLESDDFMVGPVDGCPGAFEAAGIESPGLSSAPAIGKAVCAMVAEYLRLSRKASVVPYAKPAKPFRDMSPEEKEEAIRRNEQYGTIVCRCETVTEAEIRAAIHRPVGANTIDGIKRRVRAGMGRCQGGFCMPRVAAILAEEKNIPLTEVRKGDGNSFILCDTVEHFLKGEQVHESH